MKFLSYDDHPSHTMFFIISAIYKSDRVVYVFGKMLSQGCILRVNENIFIHCFFMALSNINI